MAKNNLKGNVKQSEIHEYKTTNLAREKTQPAMSAFIRNQLEIEEKLIF